MKTRTQNAQTAIPRHHADIVFETRKGDRHGARYVSGHVILDEFFHNGRLCTRYWSACGQVWPEMHVEHLTWSQNEPADAFALAIDGQSLAGGYQMLEAALSPTDTSTYRSDGGRRPVEGVVTLGHNTKPVVVRVHTRVDGDGFLIRWLEITNTSKGPLGITHLAPFGGMLWAHRSGCDEHLPPGTPTPFEVGYNHSTEWLSEGDFFFDPLESGRFYFDGGRRGRSGNTRPAFWARNLANGQTFVVEQAWSGNFFFELDSRISKTEPRAMLYFRIGLSGHDTNLRVLSGGATVRTPEVHVGFFAAATDAIVQATHDHVRNVVLPSSVPGRYVEIEANHRGYLCDRENEPGLKKDIDVAASVGCELYMVDAGWFGTNPNVWPDNCGEWHAGPWLPNGLEPVAKHAHTTGMKFGLWLEIEAAGKQSAVRREHPDWLLQRNGTPVNGRALDLTGPEVVAWCEEEIARCIRQYNLDMYRIDHNDTIKPSGHHVVDGMCEDAMWRYYENFCAMFDRLRTRFPDVVFQNCAGGGGRLDWGTMHRFHNTEASDCGRQPRGLKILNGLTLSLPPEILLRTYGTESLGGLDAEADIDSQLRLVCLARPILRGIAPNIETLTPFLRERIEHHLALYKTFIRPVLEQSLVFHHTPFVGLWDHSPWCVLEYGVGDKSRGVAALFLIKKQGNTEYVFRAHGLDRSRTYEVTFDNSGETVRVGGDRLVLDGIPVRLEQNLTSELILFKAV